MLPNINKGEATSVRVEIKSAYADRDFFSMTFGADKKGLYRTKRISTLVSQTFDGQFYTRVYKQSFVTHNWVGHFHTIITAMPRQLAENGFMESSVIVAKETFRKYPGTKLLVK